MRRYLELIPGATFEYWELQKEIGRGANGVVYRARDLRTEELVALKCLRQTHNEELRNEFRILGTLRHPNLVRLLELGQIGEAAFFTMELVRGEPILGPIHALAHDARADPARRCFSQLADGLLHLHAVGLVHRDVKPQNVMVDGTGKVVLLDFGLTRAAEEDAGEGQVTVSGTLPYLAPERFRGVKFLPASDWFAFGVLLFEALVGELPFGPESQQTVAAWYVGKRVVDIHRRLPASASGLADLLAALLEPDPDRRPTGIDVLSALDGQRRAVVAGRLFGRQQDQSWLETQMAVAREGSRVVALTGESGIGKTALVREALRRHRRAGGLALSSRCHPRECLPFNALNEVVTGLLTETRPLGAGNPSLSESGQRLSDLFIAPASRRPVRRGAPAEVAWDVLVLLKAHAACRPLAIHVDDAQWIDHDSLPVLADLLKHRELQCCWILTFRGRRESIPASLRPAIQDERYLVALKEGDAAELVRHLRPSASTEDIRKMCRVTRGHPLAIEQACSMADGSPTLILEGTPEDLLLAQTTGQAVEQRELLSLLAVHEGWLPSRVLYACRLRSVSDVYDMLDVGLLNFERREAGYAVAVRHALVGEWVSNGLNEGAVRRSHDRLATAYLHAQPDDLEAVFRHLVGAGRAAEAIPYGLASARMLRDRLAFQRARERLEWLLEHCRSSADQLELELELAEVLARAGSATEAARRYLSATERAGAEMRLDLKRAAAEQLLRAGSLTEGRELLSACANEVGLRMPSGAFRQMAELMLRRMRILATQPLLRARRLPPPNLRRRMEVAWSAGLGLNMIDVVQSALAQSQFTDLALRYGDDDQALRAWAVEYSFMMLASGEASARKGGRICALLSERIAQSKDPYTRAITQLSWGAGEYFRGNPRSSLEHVGNARKEFMGLLGSLSWELANCGLYEMWALLELAHLDEFVTRVPEFLRVGEERGDALYERCWSSGYCATAWLLQDRCSDLRRRLETAGPSQAGARFETPEFFNLIALVRADLYEGRGSEALARVTAAWPRIRRTGLLRLQWFRFTLGVLRLQAAMATTELRGREDLLSSWTDHLAASRHAAATAWATLFREVLGLRTKRWSDANVERLSRAATSLAGCGQNLAALGTLQQLAERGCVPAPNWPQSVRMPNRAAPTVSVAIF